MRLDEVTGSQLVHVNFSTGTQWTMMLRLLGYDGADRPVYVGRCKITDENDPELNNDTHVAAVFRKNGTLLASIHFDTQQNAVAAAGMAIAKQQRGYGPHPRDRMRNWHTAPEELDQDGFDVSRIMKEAKGIETWPVTNMLGHVKKFRKIDGWWEHPVEVERWMKGHQIPQSREDKAEERRLHKEWDDISKQERREEREKAAALKKARADYQSIVEAGEFAIGNSFPDGDPIDTFGPWLKKRGLDMSDADAAFKKVHGVGFYDYLADMWDSHADDQLHDAAAHGTHGEDYSNEWFAGSNPWRSS